MEVVQIEGNGNASFDDIKHLVSGARGKQVFEKGDLDYGVWTAGTRPCFSFDFLQVR